MAFNRVKQWATLTRTWWLYDARYQCPFRSAEKICLYLEGRHKPLYHPLSDVGDHVVVINTKDVAMAEDLWRTYRYFHDSGYASGKSTTSAWRLHEADPTKVMYKAVYYAGPKNLLRPNMMRRLHLYPDENVPSDVMTNVSDVIRQIQVVPKKLEDYSEDEIKMFPKLFEWPDDHVMFKKKSFEEIMKEKELEELKKLKKS